MNPLLQQIKNTPLAGNIGSLLIIQLLNYLIPVIVIPVLTNSLGDGGYGVFAFAQYFSGLLIFVCDYGFVYTGPQQVSQNQNNPGFLNRLFSAITCIRFGLFMACSLITLGFAFAGGLTQDEKMAMILSLLGLAGNVLMPMWFLQGVQKLRALTILNVIFKVLQVALLWAFVNDKSDIVLACWIFFGTNFLLGISVFIFVMLVFGLQLHLPSWQMVKEELNKGYQMFLVVFFSSVYVQGTGVILGLMTNNQVLGHYSAAEKIVRAVTYLFNPLAQAFFPFISKMFVLNREMGKMIFFKFLNLIVALAAVAAILLYFTSAWLVDVLLDPSFQPSILLIGILCPIVLFGNIGNMLGNNLFIQLGWQKYTVWVMLLMAILNTINTYVLVQHYQAVGAAAALSITEVLAPLIFIAIYQGKKKNTAYKGFY